MRRCRLILVMLTAVGGCERAQERAKATTTPQTNPTTTRQNGAGGRTDPNRIVLRQTELPVQNVHVLSKGDMLAYVLPSGREVVFAARRDNFGSAEQTTASGLKAHVVQPEFEELKGYGVSTSSRAGVSIYSFEVDAFRVSRAEDLQANHALPVVVRVERATTATEMNHQAARDIFARESAPASPVLRVPISTIHHELLRRLNVPVRLVQVNDAITFQLSGDLADRGEAARLGVVQSVMNEVVDRYDRIERIDQFSIEVLKEGRSVLRFLAKRALAGQWELHSK